MMWFRAAVWFVIPLFVATGATAEDVGGISGAMMPPASPRSFMSETLSLGGAATRLQVQSLGRFSVGLAGNGPDVPTGRGGKVRRMTPGGYLAWNGSDYRVDLDVHPLGIGGFSASMAALAGTPSGETGTSYGLGLGVIGERFSVNPSNPLGMTETDGNGSDLNLTLTIHHAFTPNLSVAGTAEARQGMTGQTEGIANQREILFGAGLGIRF